MAIEVLNRWAMINGFIDWRQFMESHGANSIPMTIVDELIELALNFDY